MTDVQPHFSQEPVGLRKGNKMLKNPKVDTGKWKLE